MTRGKVKAKMNGYGFIEIAPGKDAYFRADDLLNIDFDQLSIGDEVEFESRANPKGQRAYKIRSFNAPQVSERKENDSDYRFLNPYNFVRFLSEGVASDEETRLLGRCEPPPHDRFSGISGRITCTMQTVTPLFIAGDKIEEENGHKKLCFFEAGDQKLIPASSLRGMIRSVFETITNSCMAMMEGAKQSYHFPPREALVFLPARVEMEKNKWYLRLLPGSADADPVNNKLQYAAWIRRYKPIKPTKVYNLDNNKNYRARPAVSLDNFKHGDPCWAIMSSKPFRRNTYPDSQDWFLFWNVEKLLPEEKSKEELQKEFPDKRIEKGWIFINNQNIENKHDERLFFRSDDNDSWPERIELPKSVRDNYEALILDYQQRHQDNIKDLKEKEKLTISELSKPYGDPKKPAFSRFILNSQSKLKPGELVYVMLDKSDLKQVEFIVPVSIPRLMFENSIRDVLETNQSYNANCDQYNRSSQNLSRLKLCPACRLFGWVRSESVTTPDSHETIMNAYGGRLSFSNGVFQTQCKIVEEAKVLAILGSPKPTTTAFYLATKKGKAEFSIHYDTDGAQLRGRKFYRHHGIELFERKHPSGENEWEQPGRKPNKQNVTLQEILDRDNVFSFTIDFENLAPVELGALLWTLKLEDGWYHRLGLAKPLGFGSLKPLEVKLEIISHEDRYKNFAASGVREISSEKWQKDYVMLFKNAMEKRYDSKFEDLPNFQDLKALIGTVPSLPVHYPRPTKTPDENGEQFKWFVGNNRRRKVALPLAPDDTIGFEVWDERGE